MIKEFYKKHEKHLTTIAFLGGFILDNLTIQRVDRWFEHAFLIFYVILSGFLIIVYNSFDLERPRQWGITRRLVRFVRWFPIPIQFSLGALFSGSLVFYSRSASLSVSWPFLALLVLFIVGNELVHGRYGRLTLQISGYFVAVFLYASFALPVLLRHIGTPVFILSSVVSFVMTLALLLFIKLFSRERFLKSRRLAYLSLFSLLALFNVLYFSNLIPPLPLSLKEIGIYHTVSRNPVGEYVLYYEPAEWYHFRLIHPVFHISENNDTAYIFSSIFAPTRLSAVIVHEWFSKNASGFWVSKGTSSFPIVGGRDGGYRGYTSKEVSPGEWRVDVKTNMGALIGRMHFAVEGLTTPPVLETIIR